MSLADDYSSDEGTGIQLFNSRRNPIDGWDAQEQERMANRKLSNREGRSFVDTHSKGITGGLAFAIIVGGATIAYKKFWSEKACREKKKAEPQTPPRSLTRKRDTGQRQEGEEAAPLNPSPSEAALHPAKKHPRLGEHNPKSGAELNPAVAGSSGASSSGTSQGTSTSGPPRSSFPAVPAVMNSPRSLSDKSVGAAASTEHDRSQLEAAKAKEHSKEQASLSQQEAEAQAQATTKAEETAKREAEAESRAKTEADNKARLAAKEEAKRKAEAEQAKQKAEEKAKHEAEQAAKLEADEKAKRKSKEEIQRKAEEEARCNVEAEAKRKEEEEAKRKAEEEEAKRKAEEEGAKRKAEEGAKRKAEEEAERKQGEEAKRNAEEEEAKHKEEEEDAKRKEEAKAKRKVEEVAERKKEEEAKRKAEEEAKRKAEEEAVARAEEEAKQRAKLETEKKARQEAEQKQQAEDGAKAKKEAERQQEHEAVAESETKADTDEEGAAGNIRDQEQQAKHDGKQLQKVVGQKSGAKAAAEKQAYQGQNDGAAAALKQRNDAHPSRASSEGIPSANGMFAATTNDTISVAESADPSTEGARTDAEHREQKLRSSFEEASRGDGEEMGRKDTLQAIEEVLGPESQTLSEPSQNPLEPGKDDTEEVAAKSPGHGEALSPKARSSSLKTSRSSSLKDRSSGKMERKVSFVDGSAPGDDDRKVLPEAASEKKEQESQPSEVTGHEKEDPKTIGAATATTFIADTDAVNVESGAPVTGAAIASANQKDTKHSETQEKDTKQQPAPEKAHPEMKRAPSKEEVINSVAEHFGVAPPSTSSFLSEVDVLSDLTAEYEDAAQSTPGTAEDGTDKTIKQEEKPKQAESQKLDEKRQKEAGKTAGKQALEWHLGGSGSQEDYEGHPAQESTAGKDGSAAEKAKVTAGSGKPQKKIVEAVPIVAESDASQTEGSEGSKSSGSGNAGTSRPADPSSKESKAGKSTNTKTKKKQRNKR